MNKIITLQDLAVYHPYYCSESNYYSNEAAGEHETFDDFLEEFGSADRDYNLVFRWDIERRDPTDRPEDHDGDLGTYYMRVFFMQQRKGVFSPQYIHTVTEEDVPKIVEYLSPYWQNMQELWQPIAKLKPSPEVVNEIEGALRHANDEVEMNCIDGRYRLGSLEKEIQSLIDYAR